VGFSTPAGGSKVWMSGHLHCSLYLLLSEIGHP